MLVYSALASLDGYIADADGRFEWAAPDAEVHAFVNDLERGVGTMLLGRRMYEVLAVWETMDDPEPEMRDFAQIWRAADKVVYSRDAGGRLQRAHADRARVRSRGGPAHEGRRRR